MPELIAMEPVAQSVYLIDTFSFNYTEGNFFCLFFKFKKCNPNHVEYYKHRDIFNTEKVDLAVCDSFTMACSDAAEAAGLPFVVTSSMALSPGKAHTNPKKMILTQYSSFRHSCSLYKR